MISIAIVDSGPLVAVANRADPDHEACLAAFRLPECRLVVPALCVAEAAYLLGGAAGSSVEARFVRGLSKFDVRAPEKGDWSRIADLVEQYASLPLGTTDASVVALAERLRTDLVITLDRRHFTIVRPLHRPRFQISPEL